MARTKAVGIRELKNHLSAYLREVKLGARILVLDHNEVIGELWDPNRRRTARTDNPVVNAWIRQRIVRARRGAKYLFEASPLQASAGTAARLLDEERGNS